jgi:sarcosine oxidase delta subunit
MLMKTCNVCGETKPLDEFSVLEKGSMGRHPACKTCRNLQAKDYYAAKRDEILEIKREWRKRTGRRP